MKEQKLVITGMGAVTPIGIGVDAYWSALVEGQCGVGKITRFDASELPVQIAAELKDFDPAAYMPKTLARTMDPFMQFAFVRPRRLSRTVSCPSRAKATVSASSWALQWTALPPLHRRKLRSTQASASALALCR